MMTRVTTAINKVLCRYLHAGDTDGMEWTVGQEWPTYKTGKGVGLPKNIVM